MSLHPIDTHSDDDMFVACRCFSDGFAAFYLQLVVILIQLLHIGLNLGFEELL